MCFTPLLPKKAIYFQNAIYKIKEKETLVDLAVSFRLGYNALILANREYDPWIPPTGAEIILPFQILIPPNFILPLKRYILINLPEMRLYYFQENKFLVFPIGIGDEGKLPPPGFYYIKDKRVNPFWYPPESIRAEDPTLPKVVPPGPDNPLGEYALYLNKGLYAIHGTNKPHSIGRRTTHGCFRLYPEHIELLYHLTPLKTPVYIISEPYKLAIEKDIIYLQAFPDLEKRQNNPLSHIIRTLDALTVKEGLNYQINLLKLEQILENPDGLVHKIGVLKR
ncbi:MAG: L,D-transpeptidase family protein [Caldimicrobium sp.]|nr:L,D-transpeptidase family protein [Caldimicrobium sp.]MCX7874502.1 L,D-transpeptidase family protein [Caldimicrobium sp.]MDW8094541.1 L,D-transpeptidase family protein [Caldimicrobium sp.]